MNSLYVVPDIPVPHTGDFVGGSTHVLKIAKSLAKRGNMVFYTIEESIKIFAYIKKIEGLIASYLARDAVIECKISFWNLRLYFFRR